MKALRSVAIMDGPMIFFISCFVMIIGIFSWIAYKSYSRRNMTDFYVAIIGILTVLFAIGLMVFSICIWNAR